MKRTGPAPEWKGLDRCEACNAPKCPTCGKAVNRGLGEPGIRAYWSCDQCKRLIITPIPPEEIPIKEVR